MEKLSTCLSHTTAALAAFAFSLAAISATVSPIDFAAPPVATQEMSA